MKDQDPPVPFSPDKIKKYAEQIRVDLKINETKDWKAVMDALQSPDTMKNRVHELKNVKLPETGRSSVMSRRSVGTKNPGFQIGSFK